MIGTIHFLLFFKIPNELKKRISWKNIHPCAQGVMYPSSVSAAVALVSNLALGLFFILGLPFIPGENEKVIPILLCSAGLTCHPLGFPHKFGFPAAAPTTVTSEYIQLAVLVLLG